MFDMLRGLRNNLSIIEKGKNTSIFQLILKHGDDPKFVDFLDDILRVYLLQNLSSNVAEAESNLTFIRQQIPQAQDRIAVDALCAFQLSREAVDFRFETLSMLQKGVEIEAQLNALVLEEQDLQKCFTQNHPVCQTLLDSRAQLEQLLEDLQSNSKELPETQLEMLCLSLDLKVSQETYVQFVSRSQGLSIVAAGTIVDIRIIDAALANPGAAASNQKMIVLSAAVLGGILSIAVVLVRSLMLHGIESAGDIEKLGLPAYTSVVKAGNDDDNGISNRVR